MNTIKAKTITLRSNGREFEIPDNIDRHGDDIAAKTAEIAFANSSHIRACEHYVVIAWDEESRLTDLIELSIGCGNRTMVSITKLLRFAMLTRAKKLSAYHNHPHADEVYASMGDVEVHNLCNEKLAFFGLPKLTNVVVGEGGWAITKNEFEKHVKRQKQAD